jgi:hypothetical protein
MHCSGQLEGQEEEQVITIDTDDRRLRLRDRRRWITAMANSIQIVSTNWISLSVSSKS